MSISGIRSGMGYQANHSISEIELLELEAVSREVELERQELDHAIGLEQDDTIVIKAREEQTFTACDYADSYQANKEYSLKGNESDLWSLDVQKAVSDMQKDRVLEQYQFFVGHDGKRQEPQAVFPKREIEDFTL